MTQKCFVLFQQLGKGQERLSGRVSIWVLQGRLWRGAVVENRRFYSLSHCGKGGFWE